MIRVCLISGFVFLVATIQFTASAQTATTQLATTRSATQPSSDALIRTQFANLSNPDPVVREQAKIDLMGLDAQNLATLRHAVGDNPPSSPDVVFALHDVVLQVFLAAQKYNDLNGVDCDALSSDAPLYFLGIRWPNAMDENERLGTSIDERLPGFPGFRYLRKGDMILTITFDTNLPVIETHVRNTLVDTIKEHPRRQSMILQIMRDGEQITIPIKMSPRPMEAGPPDPPPNVNFEQTMRAFNLARVQRAEDYWHLNFDAVCGEHSVTASSNPLE